MDWYFHCLAVQQFPSAVQQSLLTVDMHASPLAAGKTHSDPTKVSFPAVLLLLAQPCIISSMGCCLWVTQMAAELSDIRMYKTQSAWSPQRNLIKENTQPCWFCSVARSFLFALHKSQASSFGPISPNLFWTREDWNRDLRRQWGSMPHWRICFVLQLLRLLLKS